MVSSGCRKVLLSLLEDEHVARAMRAAPTPTLRRYRDRFSPADFRALMALGRDALAVLEEQSDTPKSGGRPARTPDARAESDGEAYAVRGRVEITGALGRSVAGLTVELWEKGAAWTTARTAVITDDTGRFEALLHVRDLATPKREVYFRLLSDGTYLVPDPERTWQPREGSAPVVLAVSGTHVEGHLRNQDGTPVSGYTVTALDSQVAGEVPLASATTDSEGFYRIDFAYSAPKLDLMVRAYSPPGPGGGGEVAHADLTTNVGQSVVIDLVVGNTPLAGTSEYGAIAAAIDAARGATAVTDLTADNVATIAAKYSLPSNLVQLAVDANIAVAGTGSPGLTPELFYAIGRTRQAVTVASALAVTPDERQAAVNHAVTANLVSSAFATSAAGELTTLEGLRTSLALVDPASALPTRLSAILSISGMTSTSDQQALLNAYLSYTGRLDDFWANAPALTGLGSGALTDAQNALTLGIYTLNHPPLVQSLWTAGIRTPAALAAQSTSALTTFIGTNVPQEVITNSATDYAAAIQTITQRAFPSPAFVAAYNASPISGTTTAGSSVATFLSTNPTFDFAFTSVASFVRANPAAFSSNTGAQPLVEKMARLFKIAPEANRYTNVQALWTAGFDSARSVYLYGQQPFIAMMTSPTYGWTSELATQVYTKAAHTSALATAIATQYGGAFQAPGAGGALVQLGFDTDGVVSPPTTVPDWSAMFGSLDYCQCDDCASVFSAAAYLTDILHFLEQRPSSTTPKMLSALKARRPDITKTQLDCDNTNTVLPSIDITNEVLEQRVADPTSISGLTAWYRADSLTRAADPSAIGATILARYRADQGVTLSGTNVSQWNDIGPSGDPNRTAVQATPANQPTFTRSNTSFKGQPTVTFQPGTTGQWLATANWSAAQSQPVTVFVIAKDNAAHGAATTYFVDSLDSTHQFALLADHSNGAMAVASEMNSNVAVDAQASMLVAQFDSAAKLAVRTNAYSASGSVGATGFAGITLGNFAGHGAAFSNSDIAEIVYFAGDLTQAQIQQLAAYALERYGAAYSIGQWNDASPLNDATHNVAQTTFAKQPTLNPADASYNNKPTLTFASASSQFLRSGTWTAAIGSDRTIFAVGNFSGTATNEAFVDGLSAVSSLMSNGSGSKELQVSAGTAISFGAVSSSRLVAAAVFGAPGAAYGNSNTAGATGSTGTTTLTGVTVGIEGDSATAPLNGKIAEIIVYNRALSAAEIAQVNAYLGARYAIDIDTPTYNQTTWSADELALHPEHLLTAAYDTLAGKVYPWSMPYSLYLDEARTYIGMKGVTRAALVAASLTDPYTDTGWVREILGMSELELEVIQNSGTLITNLAPTDYWGLPGSPATPWYAAFASVPVLLSASGLSYDDAVAVIATKYVAGSDGITVDLHGGCDTSKATLAGALTEGFFDRFHRFTRLWHALGWTVRQTDRAIANLGASGALDQNLPAPLAYAKEIVRRTKTSLDAVLTWRNGALIDTALDPVTSVSPFEKIFGTSNANNTFQLTSARDALADETRDLDGFYASTAAALGTDVASVQAIVAHEASLGPTAKLTLVNLSTLYRFVTVAKALKLSVRSALVLIDITDRLPFTSSTPLEDVLRLLDDAADIAGYGLTPESVRYVLSHTDETLATSTKVTTCTVVTDSAFAGASAATLDGNGNVTAPGDLIASIEGHPELAFTNATSVPSGAGTTSNVTFVSMLTGAIVCDKGALTVVTPTAGWSSVVNVSGAESVGQDSIETPADRHVQAFLSALQAAIIGVTPAAIDVSGAVTQTYLDRFYATTPAPSDSTVAYAIVSGTAPLAVADGGLNMDEATQNAWIDAHGWAHFVADVAGAKANLTSPAPPTGTGLVGLDVRFGYFQPLIQQFIDKQTAVVGRVAPELGVTNDVADALLRTFIHARTATRTVDTTTSSLSLLSALDTNSGTAATISSVSGGVATLTGLARMAPSSVGQALEISGAATAANNGPFIIASYISPTSVTITNPGAVAGDANNGSIHWSVPLTGPITFSTVTAAWYTYLILQKIGTIASHLKLAVADLSWTFDAAVNFSPNGLDALPLIANSGTAATISSVTSGVATITGLANMTPDSVGQVLEISGAATVPNNGSFVIAAYLSPTSVTVTNPAAVAGDANNGAIRWQVSTAFASVARLVHAARARTPFAGGRLFDLFESLALYATLPDLQAELAKRTGWVLQDVADICSGLSPAIVESDFTNEIPIVRIENVMSVAAQLGVAPSKALAWAGSPFGATASDAVDVKNTIRSTFAAAAWAGVAKPARDDLRERQRDAMVDYLVRTGGYIDSDDLSADVLLDVEQQSCAQTSRIVQALASTQTFAERVLLNLESGFSLTTDDARQWQWMKAYRLWQANREIFIYPENWIEPSLRDDKTPLFEDFQTNIEKGDLTDDVIEDALLAYLRGLEEIAHLDVVAAVNDTDSDTGQTTFHVVARTQSQPHVFFYRTRSTGSWSAWQKIDADIQSDHLVLAIYNRRPYLLWGLVNEVARNTDQQTPDSPDKLFQIRLKWTSLRRGKWGKVQQSVTWIPDETFAASPHDTEHVVSGSIDNLPYVSSTASPAVLFRAALEKLSFHFQIQDGTDDLLITVVDSSAAEKTASKVVNNQIVNYTIGGPMKWSQFFRVTGAEGLGYADQDMSFDAQYRNLVTKKLTPKMQWLAYSGTPGLSLPDVFNYFTFSTTADDAQELPVLGATPSPYKLLITAGDGAAWLYDPLFYLDKRRCFLVEPTATQMQPTATPGPLTVKTAAPDPLSQVSKVWSNANVAHIDLGHYTPPSMTGGSPYVPTLFTTVTPLTRPSTHTAWTFSAFDHPYVRDALINLNRDGIDGLYDPQPGKPGDGLRRQAESNTVYFAGSGGYAPTQWVTTPYPIDEFDFSFEGAYSVYNWELFFHVPLLVATKLAADQQFDKALQWFHYIFNPTEPLAPTSSESAPQRFWKIKPFYQLTGGETDAESPVAILAELLDPNADPKLRKRLQDQVEQWRENPFDPDVIARMRPVAYMKAVVIKYLDMLVAWGDQLFSQATRESINEAVQIYVMALRVLGKKPEKLPPIAAPSFAYDDLSGVDDFSDALVKIELALPPVNDDVQLTTTDDPLVDAKSMAFCVPPNDKLLGYWDIVADRLTKIRNCLSITGQPLNLPLFSPPIDPGLLIAARAAGIDIGTVLADVNSPPPLQRYSVLAQRATELVSEVKAFGGLLLSALEKKDAEGLALLRANQEIQLLAAMRVAKANAVVEATANLNAATAAHAAAQTRYDYYSKRPFMNPQETQQATEVAKAALARENAQVAQAAAAVYSLIPNVQIGVDGLGGMSTILFGGSTFAEFATIGGMIASYEATVHEVAGALAGTQGGYQRRADDWAFQANLAVNDLAQTQGQIDAAMVRQTSAQADLDAHDLQYQNAIDARDFMRDKFTNEELYDWMSNQLSALYFQAYKLAYDAAKRAERAWQFELADNSTFITFGYWDSARQGLLAGERLSFDLKRMEMAYLDKDVREYELTKHVPFTEIDGYALQELRERGWCTITIPESYFDADTPGHYLRRIKTVGLTLTGNAGPYTPVRCKLTLQSSKIRVSSNADDYASDPTKHLEASTAPVQAMVTSTGRDDAGLFETNLRDERYLPFERAGAVESHWRLDLPTNLPAFDYRTITDVVLHMRYTARDGGDLFQAAVVDSSAPLAATIWSIAFSVKQSMADEWYAFISGPSTGSLSLPIDTDHIPFRVGTVEIHGVTLVRIEPTPSSSFTMTLTAPPPVGGTPNNASFSADSNVGGQFVASVNYSGTYPGLSSTGWTLGTLGSTPVFTDDDDLIVIISYKVT